MLGVRIRELRQRKNLSLSALARDAGISRQRLQSVESSLEFGGLNHDEVIRIADALRVSVGEYAYLLRLVQTRRHFHAYNVGLPKTGTTSLAGLFSKNYRCMHEHFFELSTRHVRAYKKGLMSEEEIRRFLRQRDNANLLEMDSSSFNCEYLDLLVAEFSHAKFIFTLRDCYSWMDSVINMLLEEGHKWPKWLLRHFRFIFGINLPLPIRDKPTFRKQLYQILHRPLRYWADQNAKCLSVLPQNRSLIIRTHEINKSIPKIAVFIGIREKTLCRQRKHLFKRKKKFYIFRKQDKAFLQETFDQHCASLMRAYFPEFTLEGFFEKQSREKSL